MTYRNPSRRAFCGASTTLLALAAAGVGTRYLFDTHAKPAQADAPERIAWSQCNVNCGGNCVFQWHVKDGKITYMESDTTGSVSYTHLTLPTICSV